MQFYDLVSCCKKDESRNKVLVYNKGSTVLVYKKKKPKHFSLSALNKTNKILTWIYNLMIFG